MSNIVIKRVENKKDLRTFIDFHYDLYAGNAYDVPNLYSDEFNTLSRDRNAAFDFCEAEYYLAYRAGRLVGRVAAIINHRANERWDRQVVRFINAPRPTTMLLPVKSSAPAMTTSDSAEAKAIAGASFAMPPSSGVQ